MKVLVTPLDWGLGHATRCVPIIKEFLLQGHQVVVATSGGALRLLQIEFPRLEFFELPSYQPEYTTSSNLVPKLIGQGAKFMKAMEQEHRLTKEIVAARSIQTVVSDHRYGCYSSQTENIFVAHQINFQFQGFWKIGANLFNRWHHRKLSLFHQVWIPDLPGSLLSGHLSRSHFPNCKYIGLLSRFSKPTLREILYDLMVVVSGPEPQRCLFERLMKTEVSKTNLKVIMVKGQPGLKQHGESHHRITGVDHLPTEELQQAIEHSKFIVCRSGYSSLMDLARLRRANVLLVPTPGQPEQLYLAQMLTEQRWVHSVSQDRLSLQSDLVAASSYKGFAEWEVQDLLSQAVASLHS